MHVSSLENMRRCIDFYLPSETVDVVDLGAANVNGSYRDLFPATVRYVGVDLETGPGVDVVLADVYGLPFESESVDLVISGQMLEHCGQFWRVFREIERVLRPGGLAFIIAPSSGPVHRFPIDCYRFYPDSFQAIADWSGLRLVHCWTDERGPWCDLVGVFEKGSNIERATNAPPRKVAVNDYIAPHNDISVEIRRGARNYLEVLRELHALVQPRLYFEIGVRNGASFSLCQGRAIGVDPDPHPELRVRGSDAQIFRCTSDDFFFMHGKAVLTEPVQLAFIDGMHLAEYVLRDFMNIERFMKRDGVIVIDDVLPNHQLQAQRHRCSQVWTGDVWRFAERLSELRPDLRLTWLDAEPTGLLIITELDPLSNTLWSDYNSIARKLQGEVDRPPPAHILRRVRAIPPDEQNIRAAAGR